MTRLVGKKVGKTQGGNLRSERKAHVERAFRRVQEMDGVLRPSACPQLLHAGDGEFASRHASCQVSEMAVMVKGWLTAPRVVLETDLATRLVTAWTLMGGSND